MGLGAYEWVDPEGAVAGSFEAIWSLMSNCPKICTHPKLFLSLGDIFKRFFLSQHALPPLCLLIRVFLSLGRVSPVALSVLLITNTPSVRSWQLPLAAGTPAPALGYLCTRQLCHIRAINCKGGCSALSSKLQTRDHLVHIYSRPAMLTIIGSWEAAL